MHMGALYSDHLYPSRESYDYTRCVYGSPLLCLLHCDVLKSNKASMCLLKHKNIVPSHHPWENLYIVVINITKVG